MRSDRLFSRDFTLMILGQIISLFGNAILRFALSLYVLDTTGSAAAFGGILAVSMVPTILCSPLGGVLADRVPRQRIMWGLDFFTAALVLGYGLFFASRGTVLAVGVLMVLLAAIQALYQPSVQASIPALASEEHLPAAYCVVALVIVALVLLCVSPLVQRLARWAMGFLPKTEPWQTRREKWLEQLDTLAAESRLLLADKGRCARILAVQTLKLFLMFTLPWFCIRFMGLSCGLSFWQVQLLTSLMLFLSNALPNVAGMGSIETAFLLVFSSFMTSGEAMSTLMLFRIASYYFVFAASAAGTFAAQKHLENS